MAQQTFAGVPAEFTAGEVLSSSDQNLLRNYLIAQIKEGMTGDTGEVLPMIMDLTNNRIVLDAGGLEFSNGSLQTVAAATLDYEEGTFTVAFTAGSGSITVDSSYNTCAYVKVGKLVHIQGQVGVSSVSSPSGALNMTGLPFTSANGLSQSSDTVSNPATIIALASDPSGGGSIYYRILNNSTTVNWRAEGGTTSEDSTIADLIDAGSWFWVGGTYRSNT